MRLNNKRRNKMKFVGDIIITDPCYIIRAKHHGTTPITDDDWETCEDGSRMKALGIKTYLTRRTECGDWSCSTYNTDTKEKLGDFCADAGLVSVFLLEEVLKYNPDFDYHINNKHTTTWIKDFNGDVEIVYDKFRKNGDKEVRVIGKGNINFFSSQTGF